MVVHGKENYCKCLQLLLGNKEKIQVNVDVLIVLKTSSNFSQEIYVFT